MDESFAHLLDTKEYIYWQRTMTKNKFHRPRLDHFPTTSLSKTWLPQTACIMHARVGMWDDNFLSQMEASWIKGLQQAVNGKSLFEYKPWNEFTP